MKFLATLFLLTISALGADTPVTNPKFSGTGKGTLTGGNGGAINFSTQTFTGTWNGIGTTGNVNIGEGTGITLELSSDLAAVGAMFSGTVQANAFIGNGGAINIVATGFNGNLSTTDDTLQEIAQKLDDLTVGSSSLTNTYVGFGAGGVLSGANSLTFNSTTKKLTIGTGTYPNISGSVTTGLLETQYMLLNGQIFGPGFNAASGAPVLTDTFTITAGTNVATASGTSVISDGVAAGRYVQIGGEVHEVASRTSSTITLVDNHVAGAAAGSPGALVPATAITINPAGNVALDSLGLIDLTTQTSNINITAGQTTPAQLNLFGSGILSDARFFAINPAPRATPTTAYFVSNPGADTAIAASTELAGVTFGAHSREWATGALTTQRQHVFEAPTYGFAGASTLTNAINVDIADPIVGTNATFTNTFALRAASLDLPGALRFGGVVITPTGTELNFVDGVTSSIQTQLDGKSAIAGSSSIVTTGALNSGSITSGFGSIDVGADSITGGAGSFTTLAGTVISASTAFRAPSAGGAAVFGFTGDTTTGIGQTSTTQLAIYHSGVENVKTAATTFRLTSAMALQWGSSGINSQDTSLWRSGVNELSFAVGGATGSGGSWKATNGTLLGTLAVTGAVTQTAKTTTYNNVATAGWGIPAIYGSGAVAAKTNLTSGTLATYTCGAADGSFEVSANVNVTTSTTHSFSVDVSYTDETNVARVLVLPMAQLAGSFVATGLITNVTGTGPYESSVMHIRCKASTAITIATSAGGTYSGVVYNAEAVIKQTR